MSEDEKKRHDAQEAPAPGGEASAAPATDDLQLAIDRLQRLQAEFENYKKRTARENGALEERIIDQVLVRFLTPYENLERALASYRTDENVDAFVAGVEQIYAQLEQLFGQLDVVRIPSVGEPFDPALHEALLSVPNEEPRNTVIEELSPGYRRDGRVLRPSRVSVSQGPAPREEQA